MKAPANPSDGSNVEVVPSGPPAAADGKGLWIVLSTAILAVVAAFAIRALLSSRHLHEAARSGAAALARDTFGGFRDADRALQPLVRPRSEHLPLVALRSYALAQLAARYGDDQAAVDSELLNAPLERRLQESRVNLDPQAAARFQAARALLLLASSEPGSALLMLSGDSSGGDSAELAVVRAQVYADLEKPKQAGDELASALRQQPRSLEVLQTAAQAAFNAQDDTRAADLAMRAIAIYPNHWPSLLVLGRVALRGDAADPAQTDALMSRALPSLAGEASPLEQCQAHVELIELDLQLGQVTGILSRFDTLAKTEDLPVSCRLDLARLNRRLGRESQSLALLKSAAAEQEAGDPGEAALLYSEASGDPRVILSEAIKPPPTDLAMKAAARWKARSEASKLRAALILGDHKAGVPLAAEIDGWEIPQVLCTLAWYKAANGDFRSAGRLLDRAHQVAAKGRNPGDALADVGEKALALGFWAPALASCGEGVRRAPANYRALTCEAQALASLHRPNEASAALDRAVALNPDSPDAERLRVRMSPPPAAEGGR